MLTERVGTHGEQRRGNDSVRRGGTKPNAAHAIASTAKICLPCWKDAHGQCVALSWTLSWGSTVTRWVQWPYGLRAGIAQ